MPGWPPNTVTLSRPSRASSWSSIPPERSGRRSSTSSTATRTRTCRRPRRRIDLSGADRSGAAAPPQRPIPEIEAEPHEERGRDELRDRIDIEERRLDQLLLVPGEEAQGRAEDATQRAARHQSGGDDHAPLADAPPLLAAHRLGA